MRPSISGARTKGAAAYAAPLDRLAQQDLDDEATDRAAKAMIEFLRAAIEKDRDRKIRNLSDDEVHWMTVAALTGFILCRAAQAKRYNRDFDEIFGLGDQARPHAEPPSTDRKGQAGEDEEVTK